MIDVILMADTNTTLAQFGLAHGLLIPDEESGWVNAAGVTWSWWAGSGRMMRTQGEYSNDGSVISEPSFVPGLAVVLRLYGDFFEKDKIEAGGGWIKSKTLQFIHDNGTAVAVEGIPCTEIDGVRVFNPHDVVAKLAEWGVPGHEFSGGACYDIG